MLEARQQPYVLATRSHHTLRLMTNEALQQTDPLTLAAALPPEVWTAHAAGEGSKGPRLYDWARIALAWTVDTGFERWLLIRRSRRDPAERAYDLVFTRAGTTLAELAGAAGLRWTIEECFQRAKEELGLDHGEARSWHGWHRHMTLCLAAAAFLARLQASLRRAACGQLNRTSPPLAAIRLSLPSRPEIRGLMAQLLLQPPLRTPFILAWSAWRQRHQVGAAEAHYRAHKTQL